MYVAKARLSAIRNRGTYPSLFLYSSFWLALHLTEFRDLNKTIISIKKVVSSGRGICLAYPRFILSQGVAV